MDYVTGTPKKVTLADKFRLFGISLRENGILWTAAFCAYYFCNASLDFLFRFLQNHGKKHNLPGMGSVEFNRELWHQWDWEHGGDEWDISTEWKASMLRCVLRKNIPQCEHIVEIGPGAGRWTEELLKLTRRLTAFDIAPRCLEICKKRFCENHPASLFLQNNGNDLPEVENESVDAIWSFDTFVHINNPEADKYSREFRRVLRPGGVGVIHHPQRAVSGGWRSNLTSQSFAGYLEAAGLEVVEQFATWNDGGTIHPVGRYQDAITVFRRPRQDSCR
jgi:SAM-dependent methyltransferase